MQQDLLLEANLKRLKLPAMARLYLAVAREAAERNQGYVQYLSTLAEQEVIQREESGLRRRLQQAQFPVLKDLSELDFTALPSLNKNKVLLLAQAEFVRQKETVIMMGNAGTGKTHLAISLGICACRQGFKVRFYTAAGLVSELLAAQQEYRLNKVEKQWLSYDLVVLDEVGYIPFTRTGAELLYQFCASRYERGSMIITTNLEFGKWTGVFGDENLTAALLDRLTHRCHILVMNGESYRFRESLRRQQAEQGNSRKPA